jgi:Multicopper oxidase
LPGTALGAHPRRALEVVAGLLEIVERVGEFQLAVARAADEEVLELHTDHELVPLARAFSSCRRRIVRGRMAEGRLPGDRREALQLGQDRDVRIARQLADLARREAGKAGALADEVVEVRRLHVHGASFQVQSRTGDATRCFTGRRGGRTPSCSGTFETVEVLIRVDAFRGKYLIHCHKLEHEDMGMMPNFEVV